MNKSVRTFTYIFSNRLLKLDSPVKASASIVEIEFEYKRLESAIKKKHIGSYGAYNVASADRP